MKSDLNQSENVKGSKSNVPLNIIRSVALRLIRFTEEECVELLARHPEVPFCIKSVVGRNKNGGVAKSLVELQNKIESHKSH